jgi:Raf kinase inhibitor-like YbhB/YbcL family protein
VIGVTKDRRFFSNPRYGLFLGGIVLFMLTNGCNRAGDEPTSPVIMQLRSTGVSNGYLDRANTCDGAGSSPQLSWSAPPQGTRSLALIVTDRDSPLGYNFVHWVIYNVAQGVRELPPGIVAHRSVPGGGEQGLSDKDEPGYSPPCPPAKSVHRYDFVLYAADVSVQVHSASKKQLLEAIRGHVIAKGDLIARYGR